MKTVIPDYFHDFRCLAGACPDTCCGQWEIVVDEAAKARYLSVEGPLGQRIRAALTTMDGEDCMVLDHGKCPLLTADGLCPIVMELARSFSAPPVTPTPGSPRSTAVIRKRPCRSPAPKPPGCCWSEPHRYFS